MSEHTVYHPTFATVTRTGLSQADREAHKKAGWRMTPLPADKAGDEPVAQRRRAKKNVIKTD